MIEYGISREEEAKLPEFKSHDEARAYLKKEYGDNFQLMNSEDVFGETMYCYKLILNEKVYDEMMNELAKNGFCGMTEERMFSSQDIQIFESGNIHIVH